MWLESRLELVLERRVEEHGAQEAGYELRSLKFEQPRGKEAMSYAHLKTDHTAGQFGQGDLPPSLDCILNNRLISLRSWNGRASGGSARWVKFCRFNGDTHLTQFGFSEPLSASRF